MVSTEFAIEALQSESNSLSLPLEGLLISLQSHLLLLVALPYILQVCIALRLTVLLFLLLLLLLHSLLLSILSLLTEIGDLLKFLVQHVVIWRVQNQLRILIVY